MRAAPAPGRVCSLSFWPKDEVWLSPPNESIRLVHIGPFHEGQSEPKVLCRLFCLYPCGQNKIFSRDTDDAIPAFIVWSGSWSRGADRVVCLLSRGRVLVSVVWSSGSSVVWLFRCSISIFLDLHHTASEGVEGGELYSSQYPSGPIWNA